MDYKEKYEQALERAKIINPGTADYEVAVKIFPELKESEDEGIRKTLIEFVKEYGDKFYGQIAKMSAIAWLEKQGEQKSSDKVGPKFRVGDWVVQENIGVYKIIEICESWYEVIDSEDNHYSISFNNEHMCHLWTIQDAKDGDVLATNNDGICIFDGTVEEGIYPFAYCGLTRYGFESYDRKLPFTHDNNVYPATKEQRDLLFQKMKEAGYEWDAEKKGLKKIEQKPAWCEEDERFFKNALWHISYSISSGKSTNIHCDTTDWLKSLKERMI